VTWLSLDPADDDPGRFFIYLVAVLQRVDVDLGHEIEGVLRSGQLPPSEVLSVMLSNEILRARRGQGRFLLIMDDFHMVQDQYILKVVEELIANLPQPLHLVLLTREDPPLPLARLRANNQLTEIRARDLRFTRREADHFLNEVLGLSLSPHDVALLEDKTEGWIAGLQLAGLSIRDRAQPSKFIATLSGSHRHILSYLTEEVLGQQPEEVQRFLLQTSILDKLNPDLCEAVTRRSDGRVLLERLFHANLFLVPLDDAGQWYRYHHLFADLLRVLQRTRHSDETVDLHRRASRWYAGAGGREGSTFVGEAIQHALAAADYAMAVDLLERHAMELIMQGYAKTMNGWLEAIPEEQGWQHPRTNLAFAWMHLLRGTYDQASPYLARSQTALASAQMEQLREEERRSLEAEWLVMKSLLLTRQGKATESKEIARRALEITPEEDSRVRSLACFGLASAYQATEEYRVVMDAYQVAIQYGRRAENLIAEMLSTSSLARLAFEHGQLHLAAEIASPVALRLKDADSLPPISTVVYGILGEVYFQWHQIDRARHHIQHALQLSALGGYNSGLIGCRVSLSRLALLEGDPDGAAHEIQQAMELMQMDTPEYVRQEAISQQVRVYLARKRPVAAEMVLQGQGFSFRPVFSFPAMSFDQSISHSTALLYNSSLHVLLYRARTGHDVANLKRGLDLADRLIAAALQKEYILGALEALLLRAQMPAALEQHESNLVAGYPDYIHALELAQPEGIIGVFVEQGLCVAEALANLNERDLLGTVQSVYVERILAALSRPQPPEMQLGPDQSTSAEPELLIEPLTDRELDVLHLMTNGLKYKEIADTLFISLNTVRSHVKAIYGKLGVNNRTQAIEAARRLQIL
jgi:LuxR family maltose regulon positive regulatory protein